MDFRNRKAMAFSMAVTLAVSSLPATAKTPGDLQDLVGARGSAGEAALESRGYALVDTTPGDDRHWTHWWNPSTRA